ncbi:MAG TPA: response regulator transcription factor [Saprospiraceae bacterium]|nr:response regulator transcription factor [Saprospiraceae bacterium]
MNVLLIEDDQRISDFLTRGLENNNCLVTLAEKGSEARDIMFDQIWDVIILDIMLPDIDGFQLVKMLRFKEVNTPVLMLTALGEVDDITRGLKSGADDYLTKPFHFEELMARLYALNRRNLQNYQRKNNQIVCDDLIIDLDLHRVTKGELKIDLSPREFKLLKYLAENKNKVLTRTAILNQVWGIDHNNLTNVVDVYISYLRNKIEKDQETKWIQTIKGVGYMFRENS